MYKKIIALLVAGAFILSGCALAERFQEAKDAYLEERVAELMEEDAAVEPVEEEVAPIDEEVAEETAEPEVAETEEAELEETEEADAESKEAEVEEEPSDVADDSTDDEMDDGEDADAEAESEADATPEVESDDPGVYLGDPDWNDDMAPGEYYWNLETDEYMSAAYDNGALKLQALSEVIGWRIASTPVLGDAYVEMVATMGTCKTSDGYGMLFRVPEKVNYNQGYFFGVTCDGKYSLRIWNGLSGQNGQTTWLRYPKVSEYVLKGKDAVNKLGVMLVDDSIGLYINGELVEEFVDDTFVEGFFGLYINRDFTENLTVKVDRVSYWTDPAE